MSQDGHTAAEALVGLAIIGLAFSGLVSGLRVIGDGQAATGRTVAQAVGLRSTAGELSRLVKDRGPFRSDAPDNFRGDAAAFSFTCGAGRCGARLDDGRLLIHPERGADLTVPLANVTQAKFEYVGGLGLTGEWPPAPLPPPAPQWQVLQAIVLKDEAGARPLTADRIAIGAAHRDQVATIRAFLPPSAAGVTVDTANRLQGREYDLTVILHPLSGRQDATAFHLESGRLCVLTSRHRHACVVVARAGSPSCWTPTRPPSRCT